MSRSAEERPPLSVGARAKLLVARMPRLYLAARRVRALGLYALRRPDEPDFAAFALFPDRTGLFIDVGANLGSSALSFRLFNRRSPILSIEPNPFHERDLRFVKRLIRNFDYALFAAGDVAGEATLHVPVYRGLPLTGEASLLEPDAQPWWIQEHGLDAAGVETRMLRVRVRPLDELDLRPDFIKIDVEGAEESVLRGLSKTIERTHPIVLTERSANADAVTRLLRSLGYAPYVYLPGEHRLEPYSGEAVTNLFYLPASREGAAAPARLRRDARRLRGRYEGQPLCSSGCPSETRCVFSGRDS
jgi:FkbM family methyltransferase